ncbi:MAG: hypothetical protein PWQ35_367 [Patescibacteria group bacterium]|nr:hypothetical protein [Patescibacteria group bacterium]
MKLAVGFITYNNVSAKYLAYFLPALKEALSFFKEKEYLVLAFDNSDPQNHENRLALEFFEYKHKLKIDYNRADTNIGFGAAYNRLLKKAEKMQADYFLIINPDIILEKKAIYYLVSTLESNPELVAVAPKIRRWDFINLKKTKQIDSCGLVLKPGLKFYDLGQGEEDVGQFDKNANIIAPSGAAGLFRLQLLKKIKNKDDFFDPEFFMYKEDCDLAYRLKMAGLISKLVPSAIFYHDRTAAFYEKGIFARFSNRSRKNKQIKVWSFYNQHLLFRKYFKNESIFSQIMIVWRGLILFIFALVFEQYNLRQYKKLFFSNKS